MVEYIDNFEDDEDDSLSLEDAVENLYHDKGDWEYEFAGQPFTDSIELYNQSLSYQENFLDGKKVKFILLPLFKDQKNDDKNFTPLLNAGAKIIMNRKEIAGTHSEHFHYLIADYHSIFGLRLLSFQRYTDLFGCDERVLFETFLIKFHSFKFKPFYMSLPTVYKELGIKETRAKSIISRFIEMGIVTKTVKKTKINDFPSQVSHYEVNADVVVSLLPKIYEEEHLDEVQKDIEKYLEPALKH